MDPTRDLSSVTLYDTRFVRHHGVAIVRAKKLDQERLLALLKRKHPDHKTWEHGAHKIYGWTRAKGEKQEHQLTGSFHGRNTIVFGRDVEQVEDALDVLDGKAVSLTSNSPLAAVVPSGTILVIRADGISGSATPFKSAVVRDSERLSFVAGEENATAFAKGLLVAGSGEVAEQLRAVIEGFRAMVVLRHGSDEHVTKLLKGLKVVTADNTVVMEWTGSVDDLERIAAKMGEHKWGRGWRKWHGERGKGTRGGGMWRRWGWNRWKRSHDSD
jgi:hypothetical protein